MKLLAELKGTDYGLEGGIEHNRPYKLRRAARAVILDKEGNIAFQYIGRDGYYKLPGGGIDQGESIEDGLRREIREEAGSEIVIGEPIGLVIEYRNEFDVIQLSYTYLAELDGEVGEVALEQEEIDEGMVPMWLPLDEAIEKIKSSKTDLYKAKFIVDRDLRILESAKVMLTK